MNCLKQKKPQTYNCCSFPFIKMIYYGQEDYMKIKLCSTCKLPGAFFYFLYVTRVGDDYIFPKAKYTFHALT